MKGVHLPKCQAVKTPRHGRETSLTNFMVITTVLMKIPVLYRYGTVDLWTASRPACWLHPGIYTVAYPRGLESSKVLNLGIRLEYLSPLCALHVPFLLFYPSFLFCTLSLLNSCLCSLCALSCPILSSVIFLASF
jgi:hypothetical protein